MNYIAMDLFLVTTQGGLFSDVEGAFKWIIGGACVLILMFYKNAKKSERDEWVKYNADMAAALVRIEKKVDDNTAAFVEFKDQTNERIKDIQDVQKYCKNCPKPA